MRRLVVAVVALLVAAPAHGDDSTRKHQLDSRIGALQSRLSSQKTREQSLRAEVDDYTSRIRALEARVGDVSLRLQTLDDDLALHQHRLGALDQLYGIQIDRLRFLRRQFAIASRMLDERLVDIYESDRPSTLDVFLGARDLDDALDQVLFLNEIGVQDRRISADVSGARTQMRAAHAKTTALRAHLHGETAVIAARVAQVQQVRDELVGARDDLSSTRQNKLVDLSQLTASERAEASEIDALQASSQAIAERIRSAQGGDSPAPSSVSASGMIWPVSGPITSPFGWRWGRMHEGIDIGVGYGTPIHAAAAGTVIYCGWEEGYGNFVVIDHGGNVATAYGHQERIAVSCGEHVEQGQVIGYVGCTGHCFGPHLHFEVRVGGNPVDPLGYL
jgi:murein DD-endopeptidase MepM/ murein hydrolase activator NlpD